MKSDLCHLTLAEPPEFLFCAVREDDFDNTFRSGLKRKKMPFVELFISPYDAKRTIKCEYPSIFTVLSGVMAEDGYRFFHAETGEWLTDEIPARYLRIS